jgi:hypothetical protein
LKETVLGEEEEEEEEDAFVPGADTQAPPAALQGMK